MRARKFDTRTVVQARTRIVGGIGTRALIVNQYSSILNTRIRIVSLLSYGNTRTDILVKS